jgi:hypothetical protein
MGTLGVCERGIFFARGKNWVWVLGLGENGEVAATIGITFTAPKLELNFHRKIGMIRRLLFSNFFELRGLPTPPECRVNLEDGAEVNSKI